MSEAHLKRFMSHALKLAGMARNKTLPNPMVGAVIVKGGRVVGAGYHRKAGGAHAEVLAIRSAGRRARGGTMFVTMEPCNHFGRTPPCTELILRSGIKRLVIGMKDPNPLVNGRGIRRLRRAGLDIKVGVLKEECRLLNEVYIKNITKRMPFVIFKVAQTLDGRIATKKGDSRWITSKASRRYVYRWRAGVEGIMVGIETILKDDPSLTTHGVSRHNPVRIVVDSNLRIPLKARVLNDSFRKQTFVATTYGTPREKTEEINRLCAGIIRVPSRRGMVDLRQLLKKLYKIGILRLLVEGGAILGASLLTESLIDKVLFFYAPKLIGDGKGVFEGAGWERIRYARKVKDVKISRVGGDIVIEGRL